MEKTAAEIYEQIWKLRSAQSDCSLSERAAIEKEITALFAQLNNLKEN